MIRQLSSFAIHGLLLGSFAVSATAQQTQPVFKDSRDGQTYPIIEVGGMRWFARNLNYQTENSYCYDEKPKHCENHGRLYRWEAALSACPSGWHLSTEYEWQSLEVTVEMPFAELEARGDRGTKEGARLKKGGDTGFNAQLSGWRRSEDGAYEAINDNAAYWTSTESDLNHAWHRDVDTDDDMIFRSRVVKPYGLSVRCVANRSEEDGE